MNGNHTYGQELDLRDSEYIGNLHPVFDTVLDTYKNVSDPPYVTGSITLWDVLQKIKYNLIYDIEPQMYLTNKYVDNSLNPVYDELKEKQPAICYNASFHGYKNLKNTKTIHNLMFLDIDNFSSKEEALAYKTEIISRYDWILACCLSLSKIGLHVIVMVDKITNSNDYNRKYDFISKTYFNGGLDDDSKSLSRFTIIPYDHDIFINDNPIVFPIDSIITKSMSSSYINGNSYSNALSHSESKSMSSVYIKSLSLKDEEKSMSSTYIHNAIASSNALSHYESKSMSGTYIQSRSQHDNEKSMSCCMGGEGICTTHTFSELQMLNEFLNTSAIENGLVYKSFANEDLIEDPDKPIFNFDGFPYVEINLFIYGKKSITEGRRTSFLGAIMSQMIYLNVMLPDKPNPDIRKNLLGFMKSVNRKYCNPTLPDNELLKSYNYHWKRYHEGSLDVRKYIKPKRSLWSVNCSLTGNQKKSKTMTRIHKYKRDNNLEILQEVIQQMATNGEKITQELVADEIKKRGIKGLGISTIKNLWKHFKPSVQEYKKGRSNEISKTEPLMKKDMNKKKEESEDNDDIYNDFEDDALDIGRDAIENYPNLLKNPDPENNSENNQRLIDEELSRIYNRVYSKFLNKLSKESSQKLWETYKTEILSYTPREQRLLLRDISEVSMDDFWKHNRLENNLKDLLNEFNDEINKQS